jgi:hypothetical protein
MRPQREGLSPRRSRDESGNESASSVHSQTCPWSRQQVRFGVLEADWPGGVAQQLRGGVEVCDRVWQQDDWRGTEEEDAWEIAQQHGKSTTTGASSRVTPSSSRTKAELKSCAVGSTNAPAISL